MGGSSSKDYAQEETIISEELDEDVDPQYRYVVTRFIQKLESASKETDVGIKQGLVSRAVFEKAFNGPLQKLGQLLFDHIQRADRSTQVSEHITERQLKKVCKEILGLFTENQQHQYYFDLFSQGSGSLSREDGALMVNMCFSLALAVANLPIPGSYDNDPILEAIIKSMFGCRDSLTFHQFSAWVSRHSPHLLSGVHSWLMEILTRPEHNMDKMPAKTPQLNYLLGTSRLLSLSTLWALSCVLPYCFIHQQNTNIMDAIVSPAALMNKLVHVSNLHTWEPLYNSGEHGLSYNRFQNHVFSYKGPSLMLISFEGRNVYCIASDTEWRESSHRWGGSHSMVVQLQPHFNMLQGGEKMFYLNYSARGLPRGIHVGKDPKSLVLEIDDGMMHVKHYGVTAPIHNIEVMGCAGSETKAAQVRQKQWEHKEATKHASRKLKLESWNETPDRQLLEMVGIRTTYSEHFVRPESDSD